MINELENRQRERNLIIRRTLEQLAHNFYLSDGIAGEINSKVGTNETAYSWIDKNANSLWEKEELGMFYRDCKYNHCQRTKPSNIHNGRIFVSGQDKISDELNKCEWNYR